MEEQPCEAKCYERPSTRVSVHKWPVVGALGEGNDPLVAWQKWCLRCLPYRQFYCAQVQWYDSGGAILGGSPSVDTGQRKW